jgi:CRP-like cAMP-binding protein
MTATAADLRRVPLFQGMTDRAIDAIADLARDETFDAGTRLVTEGEEGDAFFLLVEGAVEVRQAGSVIGSLRGGDFFGEVSLLDGRPRTATVTALEPVRALRVGRDDFLQLMDRYSAVRLGILVGLADRLRRDEATALA